MEAHFQPPPRSLSVLSKLMILFGGFYQQFGWFFFFFGLGFFWIFQFEVFASSGGEEWWTVLLILLFPLVGLIFVASSFRTNMKHLDLLENGIFALGKFKEKWPNGTRINDQPEYKFTFTFVAKDGQTYESTGKTHLVHLLADMEGERLLYASHDPHFSSLYDIIPFAPAIDEAGRMKQVHPRHIVVLILPLISLLVHGGILIFGFL